MRARRAPRRVQSATIRTARTEPPAPQGGNPGPSARSGWNPRSVRRPPRHCGRRYHVVSHSSLTFISPPSHAYIHAGGHTKKQCNMGPFPPTNRPSSRTRRPSRWARVRHDVPFSVSHREMVAGFFRRFRYTDSKTCLHTPCAHRCYTSMEPNRRGSGT